MIRAASVASPAWWLTLRPIEAVVFDMDGVLIDSEPIWRAVEREVFAGVGIELTDEDLFPTMGVRIADVVDRWYRRHPWPEPSREAIAEAIVDGVVRAIGERGALLEGATAAVDHVRGLGLRVALASSSPMPLIRAVLSLGGLAERFDAVVSGEDEELGKPDPAVYLSAARRLACADRSDASPWRTRSTASGRRRPPGWSASRSPRSARTTASPPKRISCSDRSRSSATGCGSGSGLSR